MKLKSGIIINEMQDDFVAVAAGEAGKAFNGMIKMNGTAAFIAKALQTEIDEDGIVAAILAEYEVDGIICRGILEIGFNKNKARFFNGKNVDKIIE